MTGYISRWFICTQIRRLAKTKNNIFAIFSYTTESMLWRKARISAHHLQLARDCMIIRDKMNCIPTNLNISILSTQPAGWPDLWSSLGYRVFLQTGMCEHRGRHAKIFGWAKSLPPPLPFTPILPSFPTMPSLSIPFPSPSSPSLFPPLRSSSLNTAKRSGERCKFLQRGLGRSPAKSKFRWGWCISALVLALKSDIWWHQFY